MIKDSIDRYVSDVEIALGVGVYVHTIPITGQMADDIRAMLQDAYPQGLIGCLFVGDIAPVWYEGETENLGKWKVVTDLFYMDLDGV